MKKLIILTTLFVFLLVFIAPAGLALFIKVIPYNDQPGYSVNERRSLYSLFKASQRFVSQEDRLTAIGLTVGNPNLKNKKEIEFKLYDEAGVLIRESVLSGLNIPDGNFTRFVFEPIPNSKGKAYRFTLATPNAGEEEVIYVYFTQTTPIWVGETSFVEGEVFEEGKLSFVTYHSPESKFSLIRKIYSSWLDRLL